MLDALKNPIIFGNFYGYSTSKNGHLTVVVGKATETAEVRKADTFTNDRRLKVTLSHCREASGVYGQTKEFIAQERSRTVYSAHCFPVTL